MTRETKIGLLVGLAFIIVIGILLSDHLTSSTEPPPVNYSNTGNDVRRSYTTPGVAQNSSPIVVTPQVQPQQPVPTPRDIQRPTAPTEVVKIDVGPGSLSPARGSLPSTQTPMAAQPEPPIRFADPHPIRANDGPTGAVAKIAQDAGEPLITAYPSGGAQNPAPVVAAPSDPNSREYVAQPGDSLSRITAKVFGTSTKAGQDAIVALNPALKAEPNKIIAGKTYRVPTNALAPSASAVAPQAISAPAPSAPKISQPVSSNPTNEVWYTVKPGDTLTSIASEELGDSSNTIVESIKALNHDTLPDPNILRINQKIRLPSKPVAVVN